jgi:hypothetical protein
MEPPRVHRRAEGALHGQACIRHGAPLSLSIEYVRAVPDGRPPFAEFFVSHHVGDFLLQTDFQALNKQGGLDESGDPRRALVNHALAYTAAFAPALVGVARRTSVPRALTVAALIALPHMAIDDGRLVAGFMSRVKRTPADVDEELTLKVDQSMHIVCLWAAAFVARER